MEGDIINDYMEYTRNTEPPRIFHRWCFTATLGALLGRRVYLSHGHFKIYPNLYLMLVGESGTRKSTAIKMVKKLASAAGYTNFAADRTSKEKFLSQLAGKVEDEWGDRGDGGGRKGKKKEPDITNLNLWGEEEDKTPKEVFITADEFNDFAGSSNYELHTTLGNLWDWDDENEPFRNEFKSGSVNIWQPTVSLLSGNTQEGFTRAFPPDTVGQGFLSRMLLIHGTKTDIKIAFPPVPSVSDTSRIITTLMRIRANNAFGEVIISQESYKLLTDIYNSWVSLSDIRLNSYSTRRFTQLLKLCLILTCARFEKELTPETVIYANTFLSAAEINMPRALGEFGKARNSDISNKLITYLERASKPQTLPDIWKHVGHGNLAKPLELQELIEGLKTADKVQYVSAGKNSGWLAKRIAAEGSKFVNWDLLTEEEKGYLV